MELHELNKGDKFEIVGYSGTVYVFDHVDGMYSYNYDSDGKVVHFKQWTPVRIFKSAPTIND